MRACGVPIHAHTIVIVADFTSDQHGYDAENLLRTGRGRHVAESDAGQTRTRKVQRRYIRLRVRHVLDIYFQTLCKSV